MNAFGSSLADWLLVGVGAAFGAMVRLLAERAAIRRGTRWPWGTIGVNVVGAAVAGGLAGAVVDGAFDATTRSTLVALVGVGFCGALTTFSAIALRIDDDLQHQRWRDAVGIPAVTVALGLPLAALAFAAV